jgi:hypothetical protein
MGMWMTPSQCCQTCQTGLPGERGQREERQGIPTQPLAIRLGFYAVTHRSGRGNRVQTLALPI